MSKGSNARRRSELDVFDRLDLIRTVCDLALAGHLAPETAADRIQSSVQWLRRHLTAVSLANPGPR